MHIIGLLRKLTAIAALVSLVACTGITAVTGPFEVDGGYKVQLGETWSAFPKDSRTKLRNLTIDGTSLNSLTFAASLKDGHMLIKTYDREKLIPKYRSDMTMTEIVEFIRDSLSAGGMNDAMITTVRPDRFGSIDGVRFDISGATERGLLMSGTGKAAIENGQLHLIVYTAPTEYYYGLHKEEVNAILDSVELL